MTKAELIAVIVGTINNSVANKSITPDSLTALLTEMVNFSSDNDFDSAILWKGRIVQSGTDAPTIDEYINNTGETITTSRIGVGIYDLNGFNGQLTGNLEINCSNGMIDSNTASFSVSSPFNAVTINTRDSSGTLADGVFLGSANYNVITIYKFEELVS